MPRLSFDMRYAICSMPCLRRSTYYVAAKEIDLSPAEVKRAEASLLIQFDGSVGIDTNWTDDTLLGTTRGISGLKLSESNRQYFSQIATFC
jgi:hypothetical protein